jgi:hypothetical protein
MGFKVLLITHYLTNPRNISEGGIRSPCKRCENKKTSQSRCCNNASSIKKIHGDILVLVYSWKTIYSSRGHGRYDG